MQESKIFEGRTTSEAIENGLKTLGIKREEAEIKVLENENKRSFFSILSPRVVKVQIINKKEKKQEKNKKEMEEIKNIDFNKAKNNMENFLREWINIIPGKNIKYETIINEGRLDIDINGEDLNYLIGHRGEVLNNLQSLLSIIASKGSEYKVRVILNICGYKEKRQKALEELAEKLEKTVVKTKRDITLEPMTAYERKIIHSRLQNSNKVTTTSIGEEPYRKVVISLK